MTEGFDVRVAHRHLAATDIVGLELVSLDGGPLPAFEAGAHVDVHVAPGIVRQYSLRNDPRETHRYCLGILREPASRGGSVGLHDTFVEGRVVRIGAPRCNFRLVAGQGRALLFAGGIGITPLLSMAHHLANDAVPFMLHYCTRSRERAAFADELAVALFVDCVVLHHDDGLSEQRLDLDTALGMHEASTHLYVCGPAGFIDFVTGGARVRGWTDDQIHVERFSADVDATGDSFEVVAQRSGATVTVGPDETIAHALIRAGVDVPMSCEQGVCGTCLTNVIEGRPDHRDMYQTDDEKAQNAQITPCCSRALTRRLVLDI